MSQTELQSKGSRTIGRGVQRRERIQRTSKTTKAGDAQNSNKIHNAQVDETMTLFCNKQNQQNKQATNYDNKINRKRKHRHAHTNKHTHTHTPAAEVVCCSSSGNGSDPLSGELVLGVVVVAVGDEIAESLLSLPSFCSLLYTHTP